MKREKTEDSRRKFSEALKISWVRSSIILGLIFLTVGLVAIFVLKVLNVGNTQLFLDAKTFVRDYGFLGIFCVTILAGTIVPLGSPALVVAAASFGLQPMLLAVIATVGFTVGMMINYGLAYRLGRPYVMRKVGVDRLEEIKGLWSKWGWIIYTVFGFIPFLQIGRAHV